MLAAQEKEKSKIVSLVGLKQFSNFFSYASLHIFFQSQTIKKSVKVLGFFKPKKINMIASANSWLSINKSYSFNSVSLFIFPLRFHTPPTVAQCPTNRCYHTVSELLSVFYCKKYVKN